MEGSEKGVSSSSSATPKRAPSTPKGTDENDQITQEMGISQNVQKKRTPTKHFTSPTISTASKSNPPRKKILSERNTESHETNLGKSPIPDSRASPKTPSLELTPSFSTESGENQENSGLVDDISSRPYDPLTNYLSPRPRFLRYKPNRRRDVLLRIQSDDVKKDEEGSDDASSGSSAAAADVDVNENQEDEESEGEFEELEDERGWSLRGVLKFLLVVLVLVLCTSYISEMNSPTPSPVVRTVRDLKDCYHTIQDHVYNFVKRNGGEEEGKSEVVEMESEILEMLEDDEKRDVSEIGKDREFEEATDIAEDKGKEAIHVVGLQAAKIAEGGNAKVSDKVVVNFKLQASEAEEVSDEAAVNCEIQEAEAEEVSDEAAVNCEIQEAETAEVSDTVNFALQETETAEVSDKVPVISKFQVTSLVEVFEAPLGCQDTELGVQDLEREDETVSEPVQQDIIDEAEGQIDRKKSQPTSTAVIGVAISSIVASMVLALHAKKRRNAVEHPSPVTVPFFESVAAQRSHSVLAGDEDNNTENPVSIPVSLISSRREGGANTEHLVSLSSSESLISSRQEGGANTEHLVSLSISESLISSTQGGGANTEHLVSLSSSESSISSRQEQGAEMSQRRAPSAELLSEFTVGGEISSSLRSCGTKIRTVESGEVGSHSVSTQREASSDSVSAQKEVSRNAHSFPVRIEPVFSDISSMNSPSYGRFTTEKIIAEKIIVKKEDGGNGEVKKVVTTPVRRSSRIHNRGIVSP